MMERTFRHWYKACKHAYRSRYRQWVRARIWDSVWYQYYRARRIDFKIWRYHQGWHRYLMRWRVRLSDRAYLRDRSRAAPGTADWLIDVFTDDDQHSEEAIMTILRSAAPHLSQSISLSRICVYPFTYPMDTPHVWDPTIESP